MGYIYKIINVLNERWYIGKHNGADPNYMGSGKLVKQAIKKYGIHNFQKIILENCEDSELNIREIWWINETNAINDPKSYNLAEGGEGGDRSKFIDYGSMNRSNLTMQGPRDWWKSLTLEEKKAIHSKQAESRSKGWYVSKIDSPESEIFVKNISKWCEQEGIDKSMPTSLTTPGSRLYQKQTKGWRIRRASDPKLPPYINGQKLGHENVACKGKTWRIVDGKRVWFDK